MNPQEEVNTIASTASSLQVESVVVKQEKDVIKSTSADSVVKVASSSSSPSNASQVKTYAVRVVPASIPTTPTSTTTAQEAMKDDLGLVAACEKGSLKAVKFLLEQHPDYYNDINKIYVGLYGTTTSPLIRAAESGRLSVVQYLIEERGASINQQDSSGYTALMKSCFSGHLHVTQYLVEKGADIHITNAQTHGSTAVFYAAISGEVKVVEYLAKKGADIQIKNKDGDTALMKAADFGNVAVVHYLIQLGADVMAENNRGKTALKLARVKEIKNVLQMKMDEIQEQKDLQQQQQQVLLKKRKREGEEQEIAIKQKPAVDPLTSLAEVAAFISARNEAPPSVAPVASLNTVTSFSSSSVIPNAAVAATGKTKTSYSTAPTALPEALQRFMPSMAAMKASSTLPAITNEIDWKALYEQELMNRVRCEVKLQYVKEDVGRLQNVFANIQYMQLLAATKNFQEAQFSLNQSHQQQMLPPKHTSSKNVPKKQ